MTERPWTFHELVDEGTGKPFLAVEILNGLDARLKQAVVDELSAIIFLIGEP